METIVIALLVIVSLMLVIVVGFLLRRPVNTQVNPAAISDDLTARFSQVSLDVLGKAQATFLELADTRFRSLSQGSAAELEQKKGLIDQQLSAMKTELGKVSTLVSELEKDRTLKFGELTTQLKTVGEQTTLLTTTTGALREALSSSRVRGQWGERMAEDILRLIGFVEGVNYQKQKSVESVDGSRARPDFTFSLPGDQILNMDVKFPLDNYLKWIAADTQQEKDRACGEFLKDVRNRLGEVVTREYINPEQKTLDCVLMFIPNEQIYHFIHEQDMSLMDEALKRRVVLCAPMTLFAILVVIRQASDNFAIERTSNQIVSQMGAFKNQWDQFVGKMDLLGKRIAATQTEYDLLIGRRRRALERPLNRIENIRNERGLPLADDILEPADEPALEMPEGITVDSVDDRN
jgi:DNA recombination protein RmuC